MSNNSSRRNPTNKIYSSNQNQDSFEKKIINGINLNEVSENLFSDIPEEAAKTLAKNKSSNKPTQIRNFFNEIVMWDERSKPLNDEKFVTDILPFLRMLKAKAAYAHGRNNTKNEPQKGLVDRNFLNLINHCLDQVKDKRSMSNFKLFMEAFMGFYKLARPKD